MGRWQSTMGPLVEPSSVKPVSLMAFAYALGRVADKHAALSPYLDVIVLSFGPFNAERLPEDLRLKLALQSVNYLALFKALVIRHMKAISTFAHAVLDSILGATSRENAWHLPNVLDLFREILIHSIFTTAELKSFEGKFMSMLTRAIQRPEGFEYGEFTTVYDLAPWSINDKFVNVLKDIDAVAGLLLMFAAETETPLSETVLGDLRRVSDKSIAAKTLVAFETQDHQSSVLHDQDLMGLPALCCEAVWYSPSDDVLAEVFHQKPGLLKYLFKVDSTQTLELRSYQGLCLIASACDWFGEFGVEFLDREDIFAAAITINETNESFADKYLPLFIHDEVYTREIRGRPEWAQWFSHEGKIGEIGVATLSEEPVEFNIYTQIFERAVKLTIGMAERDSDYWHREVAACISMAAKYSAAKTHDLNKLIALVDVPIFQRVSRVIGLEELSFYLGDRAPLDVQNVHALACSMMQNPLNWSAMHCALFPENNLPVVYPDQLLPIPPDCPNVDVVFEFQGSGADDCISSHTLIRMCGYFHRLLLAGHREKWMGSEGEKVKFHGDDSLFKAFRSFVTTPTSSNIGQICFWRQGVSWRWQVAFHLITVFDYFDCRLGMALCEMCMLQNVHDNPERVHDLTSFLEESPLALHFIRRALKAHS